MASVFSRRPHTAACQQRSFIQKSISLPTNCDQVNSAFSARKLRSYTSIPRRPRDFKNVEIFNLNPGYRLTRSAGKVFVTIQTIDQTPKVEPPCKKLSTAEMEAVIDDLREQVSSLSALLEEEKMRHAATIKRAALDLSRQEKDLQEQHQIEIDRLVESHEQEKLKFEAKQDEKMEQERKEFEEKTEKLKTEYRMLQASFKVYGSTVQEEMQDELKLKRTEFEWEMKRAIANAVDDCTKTMSEKFDIEREAMRIEFRENVNDIVKDHRAEMDNLTQKMMKGPITIDELKERSERLDLLQTEYDFVKLQLEEEQTLTKRALAELQQTKAKLFTLEEKFDEKVANVADQHRSVIDSLKLERADAKRLIASSCDNLVTEKIAREEAEKDRQELLIKYLKAQLAAAGKLEPTVDEDGLEKSLPKFCTCNNNASHLSSLKRKQPSTHPEADSKQQFDVKRFEVDQKYNLQAEQLSERIVSDVIEETVIAERGLSDDSRDAGESDSQLQLNTTKRALVDNAYGGTVRYGDNAPPQADLPTRHTYPSEATNFNSMSGKAPGKKEFHSQKKHHRFASTGFRDPVMFNSYSLSAANNAANTHFPFTNALREKASKKPRATSDKKQKDDGRPVSPDVIY